MGEQVHRAGDPMFVVNADTVLTDNQQRATTLGTDGAFVTVAVFLLAGLFWTINGDDDMTSTNASKSSFIDTKIDTQLNNNTP
eukprot:5064563-Pyramimonas_sp.AAC.1